MPRLPPLLLSLVLTAYAGWTQWRPEPPYQPDLGSTLRLQMGTPGERGNLLGIQLAGDGRDYQNPAHLQAKLTAALAQARQAGWLNDKTIVVLPEHVGSWLVAAGEKPQVAEAATLTEAMLWLALTHPLDLSRSLLAAQGQDRLSDALFRMKAERMAQDYQQLFGGLARQFGVTLVAGSIVLPDPQVRDARLIPGTGPLYNVSQVFAADGQPLGQPQRKAFPIPEETGFTAAAPASALQVVATPAGRLGVLICADSWYPQSYAALARQQVELLAVPAFLTGNGHWDIPWAGYTTAAGTPDDARHAPGNLSEGQAWQRYSLPARRASSGAHAGLTVFQRGQLWDMGSAGRSLLSRDDEQQLAPEGEGTQLDTLWL